MPGKFASGRVGLTTEGQPGQHATEAGDEPPFRIGILGDFRGHREVVEATGPSRVLRLDRDNFDTVMDRLNVGLRLALSGQDSAPVALRFRSLQDFHPDHLLEQAEVFRPLREARRRLADPSTFRDAAAELGLLPGEAPPSGTPSAPPASSEASSSPDLLEQVLKRTESEEGRESAGDRALRALVDQIATPYAERRDPRQADVVASVESSLAGLLRELLHHPQFQALEATWRALHMLTQRLDTGETLTVELIDLTRHELEADLVSATPAESTAVCKRLSETGAVEGGRPWSLLLGLYVIEPTQRDVLLAWRLGQIARKLETPLIAEASPRFVGCDTRDALADPDDWGSSPIVEGWSTLRQGAEAPFLGLALPRVLLRAPYGAKTKPIETFAFEEFETNPPHEGYLWGHPAIAVAVLIGRAFSASGWNWPLSIDPELGALPVPLELHDGELAAKPCGEVLLSTRAVERMLNAGLMPLMSVRDRDAVRLAQLRSIAETPTTLEIRHL